jgi:hypothetical protein
MLTRVPFDAVQFCAAVPLQSKIWIFAPFVVDAAVTSMHLPFARIVWSSPTVQFWAAVPLQSKSWTWAPFAEDAAAMSTHLPPRPVICPAVAASASAKPATAAPMLTMAVATAATRRRRRRGVLMFTVGIS